MTDLLAALCLLAVLEGLFLFAVPGPWKRAVTQMLVVPDRQLRVVGALVALAGVASLWLLRHASP